MRQEDLPVPPLDVADRVGAHGLDESTPLGRVARTVDWFIPGDPLKTYVLGGAALKNAVVDALPPGFDFGGTRVLDFGSGAGRVLRHFAPHAPDAELWGCDIDTDAIEWAQRHLSPPMSFVTSGETPPLPFPDAHFDLIYALSVFTHITDQWSAWLIELRRVLKQDGLLFVSFLQQSMAALEPDGYRFDEDTTGMNVVRPWLPWPVGGPGVYHSTWWLRAHWGRIFDFVHHQEDGLAVPRGIGHGFAVLRPKPGAVPTIDELEQDEPNEPRERTARRHNIWQLTTEKELYAEAAQSVMRNYEATMSWKITAPLRAASSMVRKLRARE